ncbi:MAG: hypothetical protein AB7P21_03685 [Lautropia sp.]
MKRIASLIVLPAVIVPALALAQASDAPKGSSLYTPSSKAQGAAPAARGSAAPAEAVPARRAPAKSTKKADAKAKGRKNGKAGAADAIALNGRWQDSQCIPLAAAAAAAASSASASRLYVLRRYEFSDRHKAWTLSADVFDSERCNVASKLLTYTGGGSFAVTGPSPVGKQVFDATFTATRWQATPFSRDGTLMLFNARCGRGDFVEGHTLDLGRSGCPVLGIASIDRVGSQSELVRIADGKFYLGARSFVPGYADERPTQLSGYGLTRL